MRRSRKRTPKPRPAPETAVERLLEQYLDYIRVRNYSEATVENRRMHNRRFIAWCRERGITEPIEVTRPVLEAYQRHLFHYRKKDGQPLAFNAQQSRLGSIRVWFKWMARQHHILHNPASELEMPRMGLRLPRAVLTAAEAEQILAQPDIRDPLGLRDRAILETLYSTGMRRSELANLRLRDLDAEGGTVMIRQGKGNKDRIIPLGDRAAAWIRKYLVESRPQLTPDPAEGAVFLSQAGESLSLAYLTEMVGHYVVESGVKKRGACHMFRHTMATLMLEGGADIRFIQAMLGHTDLKTTEVYTHVAVRKLQEVHRATHPAKLEHDKRALMQALAAEQDDSSES